MTALTTEHCVLQSAISANTGGCSSWWWSDGCSSGRQPAEQGKPLSEDYGELDQLVTIVLYDDSRSTTPAHSQLVLRKGALYACNT
jgi:nicotinamidase-related amidase